MYKDMGERIHGEQDTLSLITEGPSQGPSNSQKILNVPPPPPPDPEKIKINLHILDFNSKGSYQIFSIFDM